MSLYTKKTNRRRTRVHQRPPLHSHQCPVVVLGRSRSERKWPDCSSSYKVLLNPTQVCTTNHIVKSEYLVQKDCQRKRQGTKILNACPFYYPIYFTLNMYSPRRFEFINTVPKSTSFYSSLSIDRSIYTHDDGKGTKVETKTPPPVKSELQWWSTLYLVQFR